MRPMHIEGSHLFADCPVADICTDRDNGPGSGIANDPGRLLWGRSAIDQIPALNRNRLDGNQDVIWPTDGIGHIGIFQDRWRARVVIDCGFHVVSFAKSENGRTQDGKSDAGNVSRRRRKASFNRPLDGLYSGQKGVTA